MVIIRDRGCFDYLNFSSWISTKIIIIMLIMRIGLLCLMTTTTLLISLMSGEINILSFLSYIRHQRACLVQVIFFFLVVKSLSIFFFKWWYHLFTYHWKSYNFLCRLRTSIHLSIKTEIIFSSHSSAFSTRSSLQTEDHYIFSSTTAFSNQIIFQNHPNS